MHTRKTAILITLLISITLCLLLISTVLLLRIGTRAADVALREADSDFRWHLVMIAKRTDSPFWRSVYEGAREEGIARGAAVELVGPSSDADKRTDAFWLDYAVAARANGALSYLFDSPETREALALANRRGIPVISLESDTVPDARQSFVGVNSFELGKLLGSIIVESVDKTGTALVLLEDADGHGPEAIMLSAIRDTVRSRSSITVLPFDTAGGTEGFEASIRQRLLEDRNLDAVVCLNVEDTMRAAQAVIELNQADRVSIIAFRESKEILDFVRKGVVRSVVALDAAQMGRKAVDAMIELLETGHANDYVITDMHVLDRRNLAASR